jgi:hypothetical protein
MGVYCLLCLSNSTSRGVAIMFKNSFQYTLHSETRDPKGNFIILKLKSWTTFQSPPKLKSWTTFQSPPIIIEVLLSDTSLLFKFSKKSGESSFGQSRLDYFIISSDLKGFIKRSEIGLSYRPFPSVCLIPIS